jgi:ammonium transporter, Amt family
VWTSLILLFIKYALRIPLRMSDEELAIGEKAQAVVEVVA